MGERLHFGSCGFGLTLVLLAGLSVSGQGRPDFTGTWTQIDPPLVFEASHVVQIDQRALVLEVNIEKRGPAGRTSLFSFTDQHTYTIAAPPDRIYPTGEACDSACYGVNSFLMRGAAPSPAVPCGAQSATPSACARTGPGSCPS